ncbi:MAG TPA: YfhO family protein [Thermoanaerobaculia bacterium]|nr:YfhO family protein [Thermoanaerobaculia bacterium]
MALILYLLTAAVLLGIVNVYVTRLTRWVALALLLVPLVFTGRALLTGRVYAPVELAYMTEPLNAYRTEIGAPLPQNGSLSDIAFQMIPWRQALRQAVIEHEWPLWNRFEGCGDVLAGAAQAAPFSPFTLIALLLPVAASFGYTASIAFFIAAIGAFLLARDYECSEFASLIAAVIFTFSAPMALQILWPLGFAWAFLPLVLLSTRRVVVAPSLRSASMLTAVLALEVLSGHPETLLHVTFLGGVYGVYEIVRRGPAQRGRAIAFAIAAGIVAILLTAIALLPFLEASPQTGEHFVRAEFFAKGPLRIPAGRPTAALISDLLPFARQSFRHFLLAHAEAGSIALALAIFALWKSRARERWFFAILGISCLMASAEVWPVAQFLHRLPLLKLAMNDRLASAVPLCLGILAAFAIDAISDRAGAIMAGLLLLLAAGASGMRPGSIDMPRFVAELAPLAIAAVIVLFARNRALVAPSLLALILLQRTISDGALIPANDARIAFPPIALFRPMQSIREPFRVAAIGPALFPNTATMYGLEDARVMTAMTLGDMIETFPAWCRRGGYGFNQIDDLTRPMLSMLNIRFAVVPENDPIPDGWRDVASDHGSRLIENTHVLPRAFVPRSVRIGVSNDVEDMVAATDFADVAWLDVAGVAHDAVNGPGTLSIHRRKLGFHIDASMERAGFVVISEEAWKGWRADVDGHPATVVRANHAFLGVFVPAGKHAIKLTYLPRSFVAGRAITFGMLAIIVLVIGVWTVMKRRSAPSVRARRRA